MASPISATQLVVETLNPVTPPRAPLAATQVVVEQLDATPNTVQVTELACELIVIVGEEPGTACARPLPFD